MRYLLLFCLFLGLAGCFGGSIQVPRTHYYHLADVSSELKSVQTPFNIVAIQSLRSDTLHQERSILYSLDSTPLMLNTYYYHMWTNSPGQLIQEYLVDYLRAVGFANNIVRYGEREDSDGLISGYIQHFERIVGNGKPRVMVRLELSFRSLRSNQPFLFTRVYSQERAAADDSMEGTVEAFSHALASICREFSDDVIRAYNKTNPS